jgi:hypothetical protein
MMYCDFRHKVASRPTRSSLSLSLSLSLKGLEVMRGGGGQMSSLLLPTLFPRLGPCSCCAFLTKPIRHASPRKNKVIKSISGAFDRARFASCLRPFRDLSPPRFRQRLFPGQVVHRTLCTRRCVALSRYTHR